MNRTCSKYNYLMSHFYEILCKSLYFVQEDNIAQELNNDL